MYVYVCRSVYEYVHTYVNPVRRVSRECVSVRVIFQLEMGNVRMCMFLRWEYTKERIWWVLSIHTIRNGTSWKMELFVLYLYYLHFFLLCGRWSKFDLTFINVWPGWLLIEVQFFSAVINLGPTLRVSKLHLQACETWDINQSKFQPFSVRI